MSKLSICYYGETLVEMLYFEAVVAPKLEAIMKEHEDELKELSKEELK